MDKDDKIAAFNPNDPGMEDSGLFGLPFSVEDAEVEILPVPWDVTVSGKNGTSQAPEAILNASKQVDLYYSGYPGAWKMGIALREIPMDWLDLNKHYRKKAHDVIGQLEDGVQVDAPRLSTHLEEINDQCEELCEYVYNRSMALMQENKLVGVLGGDHSTPLGLIRALAEKHNDFGILHIDAHADLRESYEGFEHSHASIMHNVLKSKSVSKLVSVGLRDVCEQEMDVIYNSKDRIVAFFDEHLKSKMFNGTNWDSICTDIVKELPENVYVSFDIDGLKPDLCPHTGTPVPGGLSFEQAVYLLKKVVDSGKTIIGFDLCEVGVSENNWDAHVGARVLYNLSNLMGASNGRMPS